MISIDILLLVMGGLWLYSRLCVLESAPGYKEYIDEMQLSTPGVTHTAA